MNVLSYEDVEELKVVFTTLVVNIEKLNINDQLIAIFCRENGLSGVTNGKLYLVAEMRYPADFLYELIEESLEPEGLIYNKDMVIIQEELIRGVRGEVTPLLGKKIPGAEDIAWLGSEVRLNGNFVWKI
mgnify:CR=1 FL=1